ncbi:hypothetical protein L0152_19905 [bacterium]|nr:hypothetical protein [bacterium]
MYKKTISLMMLLLALFMNAQAGPIKTFELTDPRGDDFGGNTPGYPAIREIDTGDLDLISFASYDAQDGTLFELEFARPVKSPDARVINEAGTPLQSFAPLGFYTFNAEIYIDTDRIPGSGNTRMLPGRNAEIESDSAWEKVICLKPRPLQAMGDLQQLLIREAATRKSGSDLNSSSDGMMRLKKDVDKKIQEDIFVPRQVRVVGSKVRFFVPRSFLGGEAKSSWSYVVVVSASDLINRITLGSYVGSPYSSGILPLSFPAYRNTDFVDNFEQSLVDVLVPSEIKSRNEEPGPRRVLRGIVPEKVKAISASN